MDLTAALLQSGSVATYRELRQVATRTDIERALGDGSLLRIRRDRYCLPVLDEHRRAAVALSGVLAGLSAALHWGWKVKLPPEQPEVIVPIKRRVDRPRRVGVAVRWVDLNREDIRGGVLTPTATVLDCVRRLPFDAALAVADSALRAGVPRTNLLLAANRLPRTGRSRAIRAIELADPRADNPFESVLRAALVGLPGVSLEPQQWIGSVGRADLVDVRQRLAIEADSHEFHASPEALLRDMERYNGFVGEGYLVLRFGWKHAMFDPEYVRVAVSAAVAAHRQEVR
ncbi:MAG: hypothetical protein ACTHJM_13860 [Marmoricola sp.]